MYVTSDKLNNASFRQKLDPISKNIFRGQNPLELVFKDILTFDTENPVKKAPNVKDVDIKSRLEQLKIFNDGMTIMTITCRRRHFHLISHHCHCHNCLHFIFHHHLHLQHRQIFDCRRHRQIFGYYLHLDCYLC